MRKIKKYFLQHKTGSLFTTLLIISSMLILFTASEVKLNPKKAGFAVISVFQRGMAEIGGFFSRIFNSIGELKRLRENYESMQQQIKDFRVNERELVQLRQEIRRLKEMMDFAESFSVEHISAEIIGSGPDNFFNSLLINKGSVHGIRENMPVVAFQEGFEGLVGKTDLVGPFSLLVLPLYDPSCLVPARMQKSRYTGLVSGGGNAFSNLIMSSVPKSGRIEINVGDIVVTSSLSTIYPKDVYIGRIREIGGKTWETSLRLELDPIIEFARLEYVFILDIGE